MRFGDATRPEIVIEPRGLMPIRLSRLTDDERHDLGHIAVPLDVRRFYALRKREHLLLPKLFVALEALFGRSSHLFDSYKSSFYIPLLLSARKHDLPMHYLVGVGDLRGGPNFDYYRLDERSRDSTERSYCHPPVDDELSAHDLDLLSEFLLAFLLDAAESAVLGSRPFYGVVRSERIVYGKRGDGLFEYELTTEAAFSSSLARVREELGEVQREAEREHVATLLASIAREPGGQRASD